MTFFFFPCELAAGCSHCLLATSFLHGIDTPPRRGQSRFLLRMYCLLIAMASCPETDPTAQFRLQRQKKAPGTRTHAACAIHVFIFILFLFGLSASPGVTSPPPLQQQGRDLLFDLRLREQRSVLTETTVALFHVASSSLFEGTRKGEVKLILFSLPPSHLALRCSERPSSQRQ